MTCCHLQFCLDNTCLIFLVASLVFLAEKQPKKSLGRRRRIPASGVGPQGVKWWLCYWFTLCVTLGSNPRGSAFWKLIREFSTIRSWNSFELVVCKDFAVAAAKSLQSCLTLCDPMDGSPPGSPVSGILQARTLEWVAISFSNEWKWKVKVKSLSHVRL